MATSRTLPLISAACLSALCAVPRLPASGAWFDDRPVLNLGDELDRLPAKTLGEILLETTVEGKFQVAEITEKDAVSNDEIKAVIEKIGKEKPAALAAELDKLVMKARLQYVLQGGVLNELYDIRDAVTASGPPDAKRKQYCLARLDYQMKAEENITPDTYAVGEPMRPHLLYLQGAAHYLGDSREVARPFFEEIIKKFPDHPRAETAAFLAARCALSRARNMDEAAQKKEDKDRSRNEAIEMFQGYLKKYPIGRYVADAHGWLGALLWEDHPAEALEHYIAQLEDPAHPECRKSAAHMTEQVLAKVVAHPEDNEAVLKVMAQHPRVAQAAVYYVLNAPEIDPYDGKYDEPADLKKWKQDVLPRLAAAVAAEQSHYQGPWVLRFRAMLAQAASNAGRQEEALKLTEAPPSDYKKSDDLLFARIVVLQRAKQPKEVAKAGKLFVDAFEKSPLRMGVTIRLAQALVDDRRSGEAYVFLSQVDPAEIQEGLYPESVYPPEETQVSLEQSSVYPDTNGSDAVVKLKSTILDFAPLKELEQVLNSPAWTDKAEAGGALKKSLMTRKAAMEDNAGAAKLADDDAMRERLLNFGKLADAVKKVEGRGKAQAMIALGDAYEEAAVKDAAAHESREPDGPLGSVDDLIKRQDGRALGYDDPDTELENRNLMRHATRWWLRAARTAPGTDLSAQARFKVLDGIEKTARNSDYDFTRAMETNMAQVSRDIYNILRKENPQSPEARDAAYWSFAPCPKPAPPPPLKEGESQPYVPPYLLQGDEDNGREVEKASLLGGYHALPYGAFGDFEQLSETDNQENEALDPYIKELAAVAVNAADLPKQFTLEKVTAAFKATLAAAQNAQQVKLPNLYEDLMLFQQVPGLTDEARNEYIRLRLKADDFPYFSPQKGEPDPRPKLKELLEHARANPALASVQDFVDYAELYTNEADRGPDKDFEPVYPTYSEVEKGCRAFLAKYPKSPRREACSLLLMRAIYRQLPERFGHQEKKDGTVDDSVIAESNEPFQPASLVKAIADYEKEYPKMRYDAEVRNFRGIIAWRQGEYGPALELTIAQLDDMTHPDLRREAAVRLANLFADLRDAKHRVAVLAALKTRPAAVAKLKLYLDAALHHSDCPLRCLRKYLGDQLGFE